MHQVQKVRSQNGGKNPQVNSKGKGIKVQQNSSKKKKGLNKPDCSSKVIALIKAGKLSPEEVCPSLSGMQDTDLQGIENMHMHTATSDAKAIDLGGDQKPVSEVMDTSIDCQKVPPFEKSEVELQSPIPHLNEY